MFNRREFAVQGACVLAAAAVTGTALGQQSSGTRTEHEAMFQKCAEACSTCQRECDRCATHCGHMLSEGKKDHIKTLMTCRDCAIICASASQVVAGEGPFSSTICEACATACADCAKACETHRDDKHMKACAEECRRCEKACRDMLQHRSSK